MHYPLILEIIYLLLAAVILVPVCQAIGLGAVPGFLLAGVAIGPSVLGLISDVEHITHISEFGVVLLLFVIGMEMKPSSLWKIRRQVFGLGTLQVIVTGTLLTAFCYFLLNLALPASVIIGFALALSSTAFVLQILSQQKALNTEHGKASVAILLMQDLAVVPLLALVPALSTTLETSGHLGLAFLKAFAIIAAVIAIGKFLLNPILYRIAKSGNQEVFTASAVLIVLGTAYVTELAGLSMAMGAFLAGILISDSAYRHQIKSEIQPFRGLLLGAFFMSMGMSLNLQTLLESPVLILLLTLAVVLIKSTILTLLTRLFDKSWARSKSVGLLLGQSGEFALVLFSLAFAAGILTLNEFNVAMLVVLVSMLVTPILSYFSQKVLVQKEEVQTASQDPIPQGQVIIAGFGRVGRNIGAILEKCNVSYVAFDKSVDIVNQYKDTHPVFYGDITHSHLLLSAEIKHATTAVITVNDTHAAIELSESLRLQFPNLMILARGHNSDNCLALLQHGASHAISENIEASIELSELALKHNSLDQNQIDKILSEFRSTYYNKIRVLTDNL